MNELSKPYTWLTHDKRRFTPQQMATYHIFNVIRMLFNHTVPEAYRLSTGGRWNLELNMAQRVEALAALMPELSGRKNMTITQMREMEEMVKRIRYLSNHKVEFATLQLK